MKTIYIKDIQKNLLIDGETFVINDVEMMEDKNGKAYASLTLGDKTGKMSAKIWSDKLDLMDKRILKEGNLIAISAKIDEFKGTLQINIFGAKQVDESKLDDFLESSPFDAEEMYKDIIKFAEGIQRKDLQKVLLSILKDEEIERKFKFWPAAEVVHHAFRSGLIQHVLEMLNIMKGLQTFYPEVDYDILTTGIILHDIGKTVELDFSGVTTSYSKTGSLMGHIVIGSQIFAKFAQGKVEEDVYLHVFHLILSHHGILEYGSPIVPATVEAVMLSQIDNLSAKSRSADNARASIKSDSDFTNRIHWLENAKIWRGTTLQPKSEILPESQPDSDPSLF